MIDEGGLPSLVVDNSVAVKWYLPEEYAKETLSLFHAGEYDEALLFAPDLICAEFGNVLWSNHRQGAISMEEAHSYWADFVGAPAFYAFEMGPLVPAALEIGAECGITVYDALYLALAQAQREEGERDDTVVITADENTVLSNLEGTRYEHLAAHVRDVGNFVAIR